MIGVIVVTHGQLANELVNVARRELRTIARRALKLHSAPEIEQFLTEALTGATKVAPYRNGRAQL